MKYTDEINIQILISLLKKHNIKKVIASPGTTNICFVTSIQNDDFFEIYSCVDERSAAYMACGLAAESQEPVVITCTGATASRNYIPALTEAFYRKLPVIAVTGSQHLGRVGQHFDQVIDRSSPLKDIVKTSVTLPTIHSSEDRWACNLNVNKALLECKRNGGGPVHINLVTTYSRNFSVLSLPDERLIERFSYDDKLPTIENKKVAIFVGNHLKWSDELTKLVEEFCEKYNAVVLKDYISNYNGKYGIRANIICNQEMYKSPLKNIDILIHLGEVSSTSLGLNPKEVWRVNIDGEIRDTFRKLRYVFALSENDFFQKYNAMKNENGKQLTYYNDWLTEKEDFNNRLKDIELPFSNLWIAQNMIKRLDDESIVHLAILNTVRSWNFFDTDKRLYCYCNTGGFGIDGIVSSLIGSSLNNPLQKVYGIVGDLAFFYDMNSLGNKEIKNNIRLMIINNGCGTEFHNYNHIGGGLGYEIASKYIAADGHFGNKSKTLVKNYALDLGFKYYSASNKEEFLENIDKFINEDGKSIIFEIFTDSHDESDALYKVRNLKKDPTKVGKETIKKIIGKENFNKIKKIIKK